MIVFQEIECKFYHPLTIKVIMKSPRLTLLTIVSACLLALFGCAPSSGGGGSGSDEITFANITLGSGQYSGYYTMRSTGPENAICDDGRTEVISEDSGSNLGDVALSHQGSSLYVYHFNTGEVTMVGSVSGNQFQLSSVSGLSDGNASFSGTFSGSGWSGTFSGTLTSGTYSGCSWGVTFTGTRSSNHPYIRSANHLDKTSRHLLSGEELNKESISKFERYFGIPMSSH